MKSIPPISLSQLEKDLAFLRKNGVTYGLGAKAPNSPYFLDPRADLSKIKRIDCSGLFRLLIFRATNGKLLLPDGSWNQREWCEQMAKAGLLKEIKNYADMNRYMTEKRLFACFIKPHENGCGDVGHVWLLAEIDKDPIADTLESHGGKGVNSRDWNVTTLRNQFYNGFELPTAP